MKIPSGFVGTLQQGSLAEMRGLRGAQRSGDGERTGRPAEDAPTSNAYRIDAGSRRSLDADPGRVQRIDDSEGIAGPGRRAVLAYLAVAREAMAGSGAGGELAGIDVLV